MSNEQPYIGECIFCHEVGPLLAEYEMRWCADRAACRVRSEPLPAHEATKLRAELERMRPLASAVLELEDAHAAKAAALSLPTVLRDRKTDEARYQAITAADARLHKAQAAYRAAVAALRALEPQP